MRDKVGSARGKSLAYACRVRTRTVLVTGGTGALGGAVVEAFLEAGWRVACTWVVPQERERMGEREGLELIEADLFDEQAVAAAVRQAAGAAGAPLRAVAQLVGGYLAGPRVEELTLEQFEGQLRLNLRPTFLVVRAAVPVLAQAGGGAIVCVSARAAVRPFAGAAAYAASKAAVATFAEAVAVENRDSGVRCNAVLPSVIDTPANRAAEPDADHARWVQPAEIAQVIRFLCSEESAPVSGAAVPVYGRA
jgi:NAD(P)-dependent dehydrogenase (short-subunit alcohol dehydrogenase family)